MLLYWYSTPLQDFQSCPSSVSQKVPVTNPFQVPQRGPVWRERERERDPFPVPSFTCLSNSSIRVLLIKRNFTPLSKALGKERPHMVTKTGSHGNRRPFPEPYVSYPLKSPLKGPFLQVLLIELQQREMFRFQNPPSFIFQSPRYTSPRPGSPAGLVSRALLYISFSVPSKAAFLQVN